MCHVCHVWLVGDGGTVYVRFMYVKMRIVSITGLPVEPEFDPRKITTSRLCQVDDVQILGTLILVELVQ